MTESYLTPGVDSLIELALAEDAGHGDITSQLLIPDDLEGSAFFLAKEEGILCGMLVAEKVFHRIDPALILEIAVSDGTSIKPGNVLGSVKGRLQSILKGERTVLNFLQRLSGVSTLTARYVAEVRGCQAGIYDTRKTTPGFRLLEKYAVRMGGGKNHRLNLGDAVLIKDNHIAALRRQGLTLGDIVRKAVAGAPRGMVVEVEVTGASEAMEALQAGAHTIMLDNMTAAEMAGIVKQIAGRAKVEASGGINLDTVRAVAETGVDIISAGALTHSAKALDISLEFEF